MNTFALLATLAFPGAAATPCDPARFVPVLADDGQTVLYWNNPTCEYGGSNRGEYPVFVEDGKPDVGQQ